MREPSVHRLQSDGPSPNPYLVVATTLESLAQLPERIENLEAAISNLQPHHKELVTVREAARLLSLGQSKIYELIRRHELAAVKIDGATRIPMTVIERWIGEKLDELQEVNGVERTRAER
jgi:excisionase family DNA binding protein